MCGWSLSLFYFLSISSFTSPSPPRIVPLLWDREPRAQRAAYVSWRGHLLLKSDLCCKINTAWCSDNVLTLARVVGHVVCPLIHDTLRTDRKADWHTHTESSYAKECFIIFYQVCLNYCGIWIFNPSHVASLCVVKCMSQCQSCLTELFGKQTISSQLWRRNILASQPQT